MIFTVIWLPSALDDLATLYLNAIDRDVVTQASHRVDQELRVDGHLKGIPLEGFFLIQVTH